MITAGILAGCSRTNSSKPSTTGTINELSGFVETGSVVSTGVSDLGSDNLVGTGDDEALNILNQILKEVEALSGDIEAWDKTNK